MTIQPWQEQEVQVPVRRADTDSWVDVLAAVGDLSAKICHTDFVPRDFRGSAPKTAAAVLYGRELQMPPMMSLQSVHVIHGRAGLYAETQRALILREGHELRFVETSDTRCVIAGRRAGEEEWTKVSYSMQEAQRSGDFAKNTNYKTRPTEMLIARATARLARMVFPDVIKGFGAVEELQTLDPSPMEQPVAIPVRSEPVLEEERKAIGRAPRPAPTPEPEPAVAEAEEEQPEEPVKPAQRRRAALPKRTAAKGPKPAPESPSDEPKPVQPDEVPAEPTGEEAQRADLMRTAGMHCSRLGYSERQQRLELARRSAGREDIETTKDMTTEELRAFTDLLTHARDAQAVEQALQEREAPALVDVEADDATAEA